MEKKMTVFRIIMLVSFGLLGIIGFALFATYSPKERKEDFIGKVVIWGTLDSDLMKPLLYELLMDDKYFKNVSYEEKKMETYNHDLLEAMASGDSPDLFLVSNRDIFTNLNKIYIIESNTYSIRDYQDTFLGAFSIFTNSKGILALPFLIDPMVMYYNKDIFATAATPLPPSDWEKFYYLSEQITEFDFNKNIKKSAVAFGETVNVTHFKDIITTMMLQLNNPVVFESESGYTTTSGEQNEYLSKILTYFASFSNPVSKVYSWNRSLPASAKFFLAGNLATYFGFVSELKDIRLKNPNLNFDVAEIPTPRGSDNKTVFARVWGLAIPKTSQNKTGAFKVALRLSNQKTQQYLSDKMFLPPVRNEMLMQRHKDPFMDIFYREAIYSKSFIDPNNEETTAIFKNMIDSVVSGQNGPRRAFQDALSEIDIILRTARY